MKYRVLSVLILSVACLAADTPAPQPKSPQATAAIQKHTKAIADADAAYKLAKAQANRALVDELKVAQAVILKAGGPAALAEGNAIQGVIDKAGAAEGSAKPGQGIADEIGNKKWCIGGNPKSIVYYRADGSVEHPEWGAAKGTWKMVDAKTITQNEPGGTAVRITFDSDYRYAMWVYQSGDKVTYASIK